MESCKDELSASKQALSASDQALTALEQRHTKVLTKAIEDLKAAWNNQTRHTGRECTRCWLCYTEQKAEDEAKCRSTQATAAEKHEAEVRELRTQAQASETRLRESEAAQAERDAAHEDAFEAALATHAEAISVLNAKISLLTAQARESEAARQAAEDALAASKCPAQVCPAQECPAQVCPEKIVTKEVEKECPAKEPEKECPAKEPEKGQVVYCSLFIVMFVTCWMACVSTRAPTPPPSPTPAQQTQADAKPDDMASRAATPFSFFWSHVSRPPAVGSTTAGPPVPEPPAVAAAVPRVFKDPFRESAGAVF